MKLRSDFKMKTIVYVEEPLITLRGECGYSDDAYSLEIYSNNLKNAEVGKIFSAYSSNTARDSIEESLEIVYKNKDGCAGLLKTKGHYDNGNANNEWENEPKLIWFELL